MGEMIGFGRYNLLLKLGQGGMGAVFLARQKSLKRFCVIKVISPQFSQDKDAAERFLREARSTAALSHLNLINVFDCDQYDGQYFIAMEYVEGKSLGDVLREKGNIPLSLSLFWLQQAATGLEYVHGKDIIHRDIKPDNMMIDPNGVLKIMDLGLAKSHFEADHSMTMSGMMMGSPHYMSPEQINDAKTADRRTDIYSLGMAFFQMLTGHVPFQKTSSAAICVAHLQEPVPSVEFEDPELTKSLDGLIAGMTAKSRDERFSSCTDLLKAIDPWVAAYPMDETAQQFFGQAGFEERKVGALLKKHGIDPTAVDDDLDAGADEAALPTAVSPSADPTAHFKIPSKAPFPWIKVGLAFVVVAAGAAFFLKGKFKDDPEPPPTPVAAKPVVVPPPVVQAPVQAPVHIEPPKPVEAPKPPPAPIKLGSLLVETKPQDARVILNNEDKQAPATFSRLEFKKYTVHIVRNGYISQEKEIEIKDGEMQKLEVSLEEAVGKVTIETTTEIDGKEVAVNADLMANGRVYGKTPGTLTGRDGERFNCIVRSEQCFDASFNVDIKQGSFTTNVVKLVARPRPQDYAAQNQQRGAQGHQQQQQPGMPQGVPDPDQILRSYMGSYLDTARQTPDKEWAAKKKELTTNLQNLVKQGLPPWMPEARRQSVTNTSSFQTAFTEIGKIMDQMKKVTTKEFTEKKDQKSQEMVKLLQDALAKEAPKWGGPPGGGRPPPR